jgi:hypothetical protein
MTWYWRGSLLCRAFRAKSRRQMTIGISVLNKGNAVAAEMSEAKSSLLSIKCAVCSFLDARVGAGGRELFRDLGDFADESRRYHRTRFQRRESSLDSRLLFRDIFRNVDRRAAGIRARLGRLRLDGNDMIRTHPKEHAS